MDTPPSTAAPVSAPVLRTGSSWKRVLLISVGIILACCGITAAATAWWVKRNVYASALTPVQLTVTEQHDLDEKLQVLQQPSPPVTTPPALSPEEQRRTIKVTDREINAYLAEQGLGDSVKVDLGNDNLSATVIVPIPEDSPLFKGTTLRLSIALGIRMDATNKPTLQVNDISLGGIPLPNVWLGDIKGINLMSQNVEKDPALQRFLAGIKTFQVQKGGIQVTLNE